MRSETVTGNIAIALTCIALVAGFEGCKPKPPDQSAFGDESQYVVESIVSDIAEQVYYAANHSLPDTKYLLVVATEETNSPLDAPVYDLQIRLNPKQSDLHLKINVNGPLWSPLVYQKVTETLAAAVKLGASTRGALEDTQMLSELTDASAETIERENQKLSKALEKDFCNPELHEEAAVLLGSFALREHSGQFYQIDSPLCCMTAHLAIARFLNGTNPFGINEKMADAILLTLTGNETSALEILDTIGTNNVVTAPMVRALWTRNTGDYRLLDGATHCSPMESIEMFLAKAHAISTSVAWSGLNAEQQQTIDFLRIANQEGYSVEIGHQLLSASIPLEAQEAETVYELSQHKRMDRNVAITALNKLPEHCFSEVGGGLHVRIINWGQWAMFFQRHLCNEIHQNFRFLSEKLDVPEDAAGFAAHANEQFRGLRLYPFVNVLNATNIAYVAGQLPDIYKITLAMPEIVPAECWNNLGTEFAWHKHNPLPGTVYDIGSRIHEAGVLLSTPERLDQLHKLAPYDARIANLIFVEKYKSHPTYSQAMELYSNMLPFRVFAMRRVASTISDQPQQYEKVMLQSAALDPKSYYQLGDYAVEHHQEDKAAQYYDRGCATDPDSVQVSYYAYWRVKYYLNKGQIEKARQIADDAGEVYSSCGLEAEGFFWESLSNYDKAFGWYAKIEDRYNDSAPLICFLFRYKDKTGDARFDSELQKRFGPLFPNGVEKVSLKDFHRPPSNGVLIEQDNDLLRAAGLHAGDVIVAVYGVRVHNFAQYAYGRELEKTPELRLIVWQGRYREIVASPPNHRFGVDFGDYPPRQ